MQKIITKWISVAVVILLIPLITMQFSSEWNWSFSDFIFMGALIFGTGFLYEIAARKNPKYKVVIGIGFLLAFLLVWVELATGIL